PASKCERAVSTARSSVAGRALRVSDISSAFKIISSTRSHGRTIVQFITTGNGDDIVFIDSTQHFVVGRIRDTDRNIPPSYVPLVQDEHIVFAPFRANGAPWKSQSVLALSRADPHVNVRVRQQFRVHISDRTKHLTYISGAARDDCLWK